MLRQIQYFQAVVRCNSFSRAAEDCHISQSAISQQVKALETELGFPLLERKNRGFVLTPAGDHFYRRSLVLLADYEQLCRESARIARGDGAVLRIGCLRGYGGCELGLALDRFAEDCPKVSVQLIHGTHEELFQLLRSGGADLVFNDQRRAFSDAYVNLVLAACPLSVELPARSALAALPAVTPEELKHRTCILISSREQWDTEQAYYRTVVGLSGDFLRAESLEGARLLVAGGQGFLPVAGGPPEGEPPLRRVPLCRGREPVTRTLCLFWKKENSGYYVETFAQLLRAQFS